MENSVNTPVEIIESVQTKTNEYINSLFPENIKFDDKYTIARGSAQVMVLVRPFTKDDAVVECIANVVTDAKVDQELMQFLLRKNAELHLGSFGLLFDNTIVFQHSLPGINLDESELKAAVNAVAAIADYYDDEIIKIAGGKRACDIVAE
jgi:hypothetical protein